MNSRCRSQRKESANLMIGQKKLSNLSTREKGRLGINMNSLWKISQVVIVIVGLRRRQKEKIKTKDFSNLAKFKPSDSRS